VKIVLIPCVDTVCRWMCFKIFLVIYNEVHYWKWILAWKR